MSKKKKILYLSDAAFLNTGFGQVSRRLLSSLHKTGKYEIIHACQGIQDGHADFLRYPWICRGAVPNDPNVINRCNQDPNGFGRLVSYGDYILEPYTLEYKPDIVVISNDPWGSVDFAAKKKFWNQTNCIGWITYDSLMLHQTSLDDIDKLKYLYCWSSFAQEEFHRLGHKHVKTQFPPVNTNDYFPLDLNTKINLKKYFGIQDKPFIVSYVFRNQLRKQAHTVIKGYKVLSQKYPQIAEKVYLHFHTNLKEGWNFKRFCQQHEVSYDRILFSWICKNCRDIEIKEDNGNINCKHCGAKDSQETCSVGFGATVEQMNYIYNIGDCFTLCANSGATEMPGIEAMSCGLPLATVDYSYGHDFVKNDFVYSLDFTEYVEFGTQFIKVTPSGDSICDFIQKIYNSTPEEKQVISQKSRQWVIDNFETEVVSKKWQDVFDNLPEVTWDFKYHEIVKDPNVSIPNLLNNQDFIKFLYNEMLKVEVDVNSEDFRNWVIRLENGRPREEIISFFKSIAEKDNQSIQKVFNYNDVLVQNNKKNYLIVCKESFGDQVFLLSLLESFRQSYPVDEWNLYIGCDSQYKEVYAGNPYVTKILDYRPEMENEISMTGHLNTPGPFDGYTHLTINTQRQLSYLKNNRIGVELEKSLNK